MAAVITLIKNKIKLQAAAQATDIRRLQKKMLSYKQNRSLPRQLAGSPSPNKTILVLYAKMSSQSGEENRKEAQRSLAACNVDMCCMLIA